ncbi:MAG: nucleotidyl transferase AbiEii/AbiGii toxin family protein [Acidiferrobacteraceae bacterium]
MAILPPAQTRLWPELRPVTNLGFTLYGGTAIALRLGHRPSIDFDFFSEKLLDREKLNAALPFLKRSTVLQETPNTLSILVPFEKRDRDDVRTACTRLIRFGACPHNRPSGRRDA